MTPLENLRKLLAEATPGPWRDDNMGVYVWSWNTKLDCPGAMVCEMRGAGTGEPQGTNAKLIAACRSYVPLLIEVVEAYAACYPDCHDGRVLAALDKLGGSDE